MKSSELRDHWLTDRQLLDGLLKNLVCLCHAGLPRDQKAIARDFVDACKVERLSYDDALNRLFTMADNRRIKHPLRDVVEAFLSCYLEREKRKVRSTWSDSEMAIRCFAGRHRSILPPSESDHAYHRRNGKYGIG